MLVPSFLGPGTVRKEAIVITPTSTADWVQALGIGTLLVVTARWFSRALHEETGVEAVVDPELDVEDLVGAGTGSAAR